jgi:hypothetical protein
LRLWLKVTPVMYPPVALLLMAYVPTPATVTFTLVGAQPALSA